MSKKTPTIVFLGTYPPRECGIATFTQDLSNASQKFFGSRVLCKVAAFNLSPLDTYKYPNEVGWEIDQNSRKEYVNLAKEINTDVNISGVILQHEYGIFGGNNGEKILSFMKHCKKPILTTLHTVLPTPSPKMKDITLRIIKYSDAIVVLTHSSKQIIENFYPESIGKVFVIPHGIHPSTFSNPNTYKEKLELNNRIILSTFGLISRGKGIEYAINALPSVIKKHPSILYLILGETHPVVRRNEGEQYRIELSHLVTKLGLKKHVKFYDQYLSLPDLFEFLKATDIYISTSINPNQAVSGTLSYALGSGRAVISTDFAQAKEIVTPKIGRLVPIKNSRALSSALLDLLGNKNGLKQMQRNAYKKTRPMLWNNVAEKYTNLLVRTVMPPININHLAKMTDDFGLFQFALLDIPNKKYGYTLDDNARALIVCCWLIKQKYSKELEKLIIIYLTFIKTCQQNDGSFVNYIEFSDKSESNQNNDEDLEDTQSRALWALSEVMNNTILSQDLRQQAKKIFLLALAKESKLTHLRAKAFVIKSFTLAQHSLPEYREKLLRNVKEYADSLVEALKANSLKSWLWFENYLGYNNAILSESLIIAGNIIKKPEYTYKGIYSLQFLISKTFSSNMYIPIGHSHWYKNNQKRSIYDQQPEDPTAMILALASAYKNTQNEKYRNLAKKCFSWFLGNNSLNTSLYDEKTGGCYDGLHPDRVNLNQGAESLVSYLMASITIDKLNTH